MTVSHEVKIDASLVGRLVLATQPPGIFEAVGAANSGWYTLPTLDLNGSPLMFFDRCDFGIRSAADR